MVKYLYPKVMACAMFLTDIIYQVVAEIIGFFSPNWDTAIAITTMYCIIGVAAVAVYLIAASCTIKEKDTLWFATWLLQVLLLVMYYFGKNVGGIARHYWTYLGCAEDCQRGVHFTALFCQVLAILVLTSVIPALHKAFQNKKRKESVFFTIIWIFVASNAMYSVLSIIPSNTVCTVYALALSCVCLVIITIVGWLLSCFALYDSDSDEEYDGKFDSCMLIIVISIIFLSLPLYLLSDNQLPLEYISCQGRNVSDEYTEFIGEGGSVGDHLTRLVGTLLTFGLVLILSLLYIC